MPRAVREQLILDVAGQVFARAGYHLASMDEIAERADVSKPMLYAYFGSKEGLYVSYIERTGRELLERLQQGGGPDPSATARLHSRVTEFLAFVERHRDGWTVLFAEIASSRPVADQVAALRARIAEAVRRMIEEYATARRPLAPHAADGIAHAIVGAGESLANWWLAHPEVNRGEVVDWYVGVIQAAVGRATSTRLDPRQKMLETDHRGFAQPPDVADG